MTQRKINNPTADGAFGIFWDEYHSIEQTPSQPTVPDEETNNTKDGEFKLNIPILFQKIKIWKKTLILKQLWVISLLCAIAKSRERTSYVAIKFQIWRKKMKLSVVFLLWQAERRIKIPFFSNFKYLKSEITGWKFSRFKQP